MNTTIIKKTSIALSLGLGLGTAALAVSPALAAGSGYTIGNYSEVGSLTSVDARNVDGDPVVLFPLQDGKGNTISAYCIQLNVHTSAGVSGYQETSASSIPNLDKVEGVLGAGFPRVSLAELQKTIPTLDQDEATMATQAAIWHYSDNREVVPGDMVVDGMVGSQTDRDVEALYNQLLAAPARSNLSVYAATGHQTLIAALVNDEVPAAPAPTPTAPAPSTTPSAPAPSTTPTAPATTSTKPSAPVTKPSTLPRPATKTITFRIQYDQSTIKTAAQAKALAKTMTGTYNYRADVIWNTRTGKITSAPLWAKGVSTWKIQTLKVTVPATATNAQIIAAEKALAAATTKVTLGKPATGRIGHTTSATYLIPAGAWDNTTTWKNGPRTAAQILVGATTR